MSYVSILLITDDLRCTRSIKHCLWWQISDRKLYHIWSLYFYLLWSGSLLSIHAVFSHALRTYSSRNRKQAQSQLCLWLTCRVELACQGVVSLTFRELSKIISRKYTTPEITFTVRISSWNFVRVPKAWLWAHVQSFSLKFSSQVLFLQYTNFERIFWRARETLVKQPPGILNVSRNQV